MNEITFQDFEKLDLRVGTIVSAREVPGADKLLRLMVDIGEDNHRQLIAGTKEFVSDPQTLEGM